MELFKKNLFMETIVSALFAVTVCLFGPLEILMSQAIEFWFSVTDVLPIILLATLLVFALLMLILFIASIINEKAMRIVLSIIAALGLCAYLQGNWTFVNYGNMDGTPIDWSNYTTWSIINTALWAVLTAAVVYIINFKKSLESICKYVFAGIIGIEIITLGTLVIGSANKPVTTDFSLDGVDEFKLSANKSNVIVLVADGFDGTDFLPVLDAEPSLRESFDGFTFYSDTCGTSIWSEESIITLLTGNQFEVGPSFAENVKTAYNNTDLYDVLESNNYDTYLYCSEQVVSPDISDKIKNFNSSRSDIGNVKEASGGIYKMVAFRYMPHILKKYFWYSTMDFSTFKGGESRLYFNYDVYSYLEENGVQASETSNGVYQFFWIQGPHEPVNTDRYCRKIDKIINMDDENYSSGQFEQSIGVVRLFSKLIESLKSAGVYDNTTIIFTADHGWDIRPNPLLLIKPQNSSGSLNVSTAPVSMIEDYLPTLKYYITGNDTGNTIYSLQEDTVRDRTLYIYDINSADRTYNSRESVIYPSGSFDTKVKLGRALDPNNIACFVVNGFSASENSHIWTNGHEAEINITLTEPFHNIRWDMSYATFNGEQPVEIYVNDSLVEKFTANGSETHSVIIPGSLVTDSKLNIKLVIPNAISPNEVNPEYADQRLLALDLFEMTFSDTELDTLPVMGTSVGGEPTDSTNNYNIGTELYFDKERNTARSYIASGFSGAESEGTWTDSNAAAMSFSLNGYDNSDLKLSMAYHTFDGQHNVKIYANGEKLEEFIAEGTQTKEVTIPASCIKDNMLELTFELPDARSPKDLGQSDDPRTLALYFESISIS